MKVNCAAKINSCGNGISEGFTPESKSLLVGKETCIWCPAQDSWIENNKTNESPVEQELRFWTHPAQVKTYNKFYFLQYKTL